MISLFPAVETMVAHRRHGQLYRFTCSRYSSSGAKAEYILRNYGIPLYLRDTTDDTIKFNVPETQGNWTEYVLCCYAVAVLSPYRVPNHRQVYDDALQGKPPLIAWGKGIKAKTLKGRMLDVIDSMTGFSRPQVPQRVNTGPTGKGVN